jgi:hypothetical protein
VDNQFARPPGVDLITQEYLAACRQLRSRSELTLAQQERMREDLSDEHWHRCAQEWKIVGEQLREDNVILSTSNG